VPRKCKGVDECELDDRESAQECFERNCQRAKKKPKQADCVLNVSLALQTLDETCNI
jgi:hypothetical protein